jgi:hypothetical protein
MIAFVGASAISLIMLQAAINAPTQAFKTCIKQSSAKAKGEKVGADAYEAYLRTACATQLNALKSAQTSFSMKNGMSRKAASDDAESVVSDYIGSSVDNYKFMADFNKPAPAQAAAPPATPTAPATPASAPQPPK